MKSIKTGVLTSFLILCQSCTYVVPDIFAEALVKNESGIPIHFVHRCYTYFYERDINDGETYYMGPTPFFYDKIENDDILPYLIGTYPDPSPGQNLSDEEKDNYIEIRDMDGNVLVTWRPDSEQNAFYNEANWQVTINYRRCRKEERDYLFVITPEMLGLE